MDKRLSRHHCGGRIFDKPSFASTLLDSVYRSIDENEKDSTIKHDTRLLAPSFPCSFTSRNHITATQPEKQKNLAVSEKAILWHRDYAYTTSSPSESSSYGGFSSSETETVFLPKIGTTAPPTSSGPLPEKKKSKTVSIRRKLRELVQTKTPVSPGTRLASFVNSLITTSVRKPSKDTEMLVSTPASRSHLTKTGSLREIPLPAGGLKRSVRFDPVSDKCLHKDGVTGEALAQERKMKYTAEEMLRRFKNDEDEAESDSSSDLFELDNLNAGPENGGVYGDELPVFETTNLGALRVTSFSLKEGACAHLAG